MLHECEKTAGMGKVCCVFSAPFLADNLRKRAESWREKY